MGVRQELEDLWFRATYDFSPGSAVIGFTAAAALTITRGIYLKRGYEHDIKQRNETIAANNLEIAGLKASIDRSIVMLNQNDQVIQELTSVIHGQDVSVSSVSCPSEKTSNIYVDIPEGESVVIHGLTTITPSNEGLRATEDDKEVFSKAIGNILKYKDGTAVDVGLRAITSPRLNVDGKTHYLLSVETACEITPNP